MRVPTEVSRSAQFHVHLPFLFRGLFTTSDHAGVVTEKRRRWFHRIDDSRAGAGDDADVVAAVRATAKADAESSASW